MVLSLRSADRSVPDADPWVVRASRTNRSVPDADPWVVRASRTNRPTRPPSDRR